MDAVKSRSLSLSKRGMSFETFMWLFTRLSALAMYALILIGAIAWCIVPYVARAWTVSAAHPAMATLCHAPPGNPKNVRTLNLPLPAAEAHLAHHDGDYLGACR